MKTEICSKCGKRVYVVATTNHPYPITKSLSCGHAFGPGTSEENKP